MSTKSQIERAQANYSNFAQYRSVKSFNPEYIGWSQAEQRAEQHNAIVNRLLTNDSETVKEWKNFFLSEQIKLDNKAKEKKAKLDSNKEASTDILHEIKSQKRLVEFGKWLNTSGNIFRKEHFSKKYSKESVEYFLNK